MTVHVAAIDQVCKKPSTVAWLDGAVGEAVNVTRFVEIFPIIADADGSTKRLREMVLGLAVHGRLVPQMAHEEPAATLLERLGTKTGEPALGTRYQVLA